jgi:hypothetical protein
VKQIKKRLTYANVMSSIAVFLVLGGATAIAAGLAKNSVGPKQLKKNAVTTAKLKNNAVTTAKIRNGAITGAKVNAGSLGTVPNANHANTAGSAGTANSAGTAGNVNGQTIHKINFRTTSDAGTVGPQTVFNAGGFAINVTCTNGQVTVTGTTSKNDSSAYVKVFDSSTTLEFFEETQESGQFDAGDTIDMLAEQEGNNDMSIFEYDAVDGSVVTGIINTDEDGDLDGCRVTGHATSG